MIVACDDGVIITSAYEASIWPSLSISSSTSTRILVIILFNISSAVIGSTLSCPLFPGEPTFAEELKLWTGGRGLREMPNLVLQRFQ